MDEKSSRLSLEEVIRLVREASRQRFATRPGTTEHREAIRAELEADHEFDEVVRLADQPGPLVNTPAD